MCIIFFAFVDSSSSNSDSSALILGQYKLVLAANRDETLTRPTAPAHFWSYRGHPSILAGVDLEEGRGQGTWLGITRDGKFAALTNFKTKQLPNKLNRGQLVTKFLMGIDHLGINSDGNNSLTPRSYLEHYIAPHSHEYNGFNLLVGDFAPHHRPQMCYFSNFMSHALDPTSADYRDHDRLFTMRQKQPQQDADHSTTADSGIVDVEPGVVHGLCNSLLNVPWPKVQWGKNKFGEIVSLPTTKDNNNNNNNSNQQHNHHDATKKHYNNNNKDELTDALFNDLLFNYARYPDDQLCHNSSLTMEWERACSSVFVHAPELGYGTRSSVVILIDKDDNVTFVEKTMVLESTKSPSTIYTPLSTITTTTTTTTTTDASHLPQLDDDHHVVQSETVVVQHQQQTFKYEWQTRKFEFKLVDNHR